MRERFIRRKPTHPGEILEEHYIIPLALSVGELAENLGISCNTLSKIRNGEARVTPVMAVRLSQAFNTTPDLWLNLQQKYDLWEIYHEQKMVHIDPVYSPPSLRKHSNPRMST